jgi:L-fuconolactonase
VRIDAHQHFWRYDPVRDAWITAEMAVLRRDFLPEDLAPSIAAAGVVGTVAVQADQSEAETDFLLDLADRHSFIVGVVGWVDIRARDLADRLGRWADRGRLKGFRHIAQAEPDDFLARDDVAAGVAELARHDLAFDLLVYPRQLPAAERLAARTPGGRFVLDHCAKPPIAGGDLATWRADLTRLAAHENVCCKLSGLVTEARWDGWTEADLVPVLDTALECFGADRLMFGSDWPVCLLAADYPRVEAVVDRWAGRLTATEREQVLAGTARRAYRLG